ncbi:MAG: AAA family ATPase [bacterium]
MSRRLSEEDIEEVLENAKKTQWGKVGNVYSVAFPTVSRLPPGYYTIYNVWGEIRFARQPLSTEGIFPTGASNAQRIIDDFDKFWKMEKRFRDYKMPYKRGFFLSGPPGSGKTCILKVLAHKIIKVGGAVLDVRESPHDLGNALEAIRDVQPDMPVLVAMEDLDKYYRRIHENLLNIMDGMIKVDRTVFVATTNYPGEFDQALINRPGRFDGHYQITPPGVKVRADFIKEFLTEEDKKVYPILKWARDTEGMPFGHIKELIVSVVVLDNDYDETLERLKNMSEGVKEECEEDDEYEDED